LGVSLSTLFEKGIVGGDVLVLQVRLSFFVPLL
jgi:hypothetical protein